MLLKVWKLLQCSSIFIEKSKSCPALLSNLKLGKSLVNLNKTACPTLPIQSRHLTTNIMEDPSSCRIDGSTCGKELTEEDKKVVCYAPFPVLVLFVLHFIIIGSNHSLS